VDIESPPDKVGRNKIFLVDADGTLGQLISPISNDSIHYTFQPLSSNLVLTKVHAVHDHLGATHLFCISADKRLFHATPKADAPSGTGYLPPVPLKANVAWVAVARNDAGNIELYFAKEGTGSPLIHMTLDQDTGDWEEQPVEVQNSGSRNNPQSGKSEIEELISYSTDISFTDTAGAPLVNADVTIRASDRTAITVNGGVYPLMHRQQPTSRRIARRNSPLQEPAASAFQICGFRQWADSEDQVLVLEQYVTVATTLTCPLSCSRLRRVLTR
jgi:hypothetical protein